MAASGRPTRPSPAGPMDPTESRGWRMGVRDYGNARGAAAGEPAATDVPMAGRAVVRGHLRDDC